VDQKGVKMAVIQATSVAKLNENFKGEILLPGDDGYDSARKIWNGMFDKKPAIITRCINTNDVKIAVDFARDQNLLVSVKGGGHNSAGNAVCDDGIMIDLSLMRQVTVDQHNRTARVEGGALFSDVDAGTQQYGMAVPGGIVSHTGVGGLTLGGGFGWISRSHGFSIDNLLSAEVVTADGRVVIASPQENPDLFWGIRGGGGNFGIVTSFNFRCHEIGTEVYSGLIIKKFEDARKYMQFHREYVRTLPDGMTAWMVVRHAPPLPFLPQEVHGELVVVVPFVWLGDPLKGEELIQPIREATQSHGEAIGMNPWVGWQSGFDALNDHGARNYWKSHHLQDLSDDCIDQIIEFGGKMPSKECEVFIPHMEGAPGRIPAGATAFSHRSTPFVLNIHTRWQAAEEDANAIAWARDFHHATEPFARGVYVNFLSDEGEDRVKDAYTKEVWDRLVAVKNKYDPYNLFRMNQNIKPKG
jgi:FAD/FMN-containing dehydrogenase